MKDPWAVLPTPKEEKSMLDKLKYKREEVLARVKSNRDKHAAELELAMEGFRLEIIESIQKVLEDAAKELAAVENGGVNAWKTAYFYVKPDRPEDHRSDYDQVIDMLEMTQAVELELDRSEFTRYVRDEWDWSAKFAATSSNYIQKHNLS